MPFESELFLRITSEPQRPLAPGGRFVAGVILPEVLLVLLCFLRLHTFPRHDMADAFAIQGLFFVSLWSLPVAFVPDLWTLFIRWRCFVTAFLAGCVIPIGIYLCISI